MHLKPLDAAVVHSGASNVSVGGDGGGDGGGGVLLTAGGGGDGGGGDGGGEGGGNGGGGLSLATGGLSLSRPIPPTSSLIETMAPSDVTIGYSEADERAIHPLWPRGTSSDSLS